jgi:hypothetical protein
MIFQYKMKKNFNLEIFNGIVNKLMKKKFRLIILLIKIINKLVSYL